ncbi:hypothetical protein [Haliangium sp.]|uniref:hypothetical protein n=1 Tax=Haliangium sp. TaxID=2663208 RepID=UPI003D121FC1
MFALAHAACLDRSDQLDDQASAEMAACGRDPIGQPVPAPPGDYLDQGVTIDYDLVVPLPDPTDSPDQRYGLALVSAPDSLEQLHYDAAHGNTRASWFLCIADAGARAAGRMIARYLARPQCQTFMVCRAALDELPWDPDLLSGLRMRWFVADNIHREAETLALVRQVAFDALDVLVGAKHLSAAARVPGGGIRPPPALGGPSFTAIRRAMPVQRFGSFDAFKRAMGPAGSGRH